MSTVAWLTVFGNRHPVHVEIGPGRGEWLVSAAAAAPDVNFFGIERAARAAEAILAAAVRRNLVNVRVVAGDARCVVANLVADASVAVYRVFFPDPWPKTRHRGRRVMSGELARHVGRTLVRGGSVHVASDLRHVVTDITERLVGAGLVPVPDATLPAERTITAFERKYSRAGGTFYARLVRPP
jgi:tRNA (guanine-N7-)-methyltransferase